MPKGRQKNDGRGRLGGRQKGTPNKATQTMRNIQGNLKGLIASRTETYFSPTLKAEEVFKDKPEMLLKFQGQMLSEYDLDLMDMKPSDRAKLNAELLTYFMPKMQATSVDLAVADQDITVTERIRRLAAGEDILPEE